MPNLFKLKLQIVYAPNFLSLIQTPPRNSWKAISSELSGSGSRSKSVISNGTPRSASPSSFPGSQLTNGGTFPSPTVIAKNLDWGLSAENFNSSLVPENDDDAANPLIYPYERLKVTSDEPVSDIDLTRREVNLQ